LVPAEEDAGSEASEWKRREREEERRVEAEELGSGSGGATAVPTYTLLHGIRRRGVGGGHASLCTFLYYFLGLEGKGELATCPSRGQRSKMYAAIV